MTKKIITTAALLVAAAGLHAQAIQAPAATTESSGLIGKRYAAADFSYYSFNHSGRDVYGTGLSYNAPVTAGLDAHARYDYVWASGSQSAHVNSGAVGFTAYLDQDKIKPFLTGNLGYIWPKSDDRFVWDTAIGAELQLCSKSAVFASVGYSEDFRHNNGDQGSFTGKVGANYWVTKDIAVTAAFTYEEGADLGFSLGAAYRF